MVNKNSLSQTLGKLQLEAAFRLIDSKIITFPLSFYQSFEEEARKRIPRDPNDWESVALALALPAAIWTEDYDFFGFGQFPILTLGTLDFSRCLPLSLQNSPENQAFFPYCLLPVASCLLYLA